ncbi:MAG: 30S ribosomal protein S12 methylthiotransferase RimO [Syntrophomonas sp.]
MNIGFISLGCAKNRVDTEIMIGILKKSGYRIVESLNKADLIIVNTCGFINAAKEEAINTIIKTGKLKEEGRLQYLIATGCLSQRYGTELLDEMPELDGVIGISSFTGIDRAIEAVVAGKRISWIENPPSQFIEEGPRSITTPAGSAYLKIAEGCNNRCSYCTIPLIRGQLRSKPVEKVITEARELVDKGIKELVVIAQDTAAYGSDLYGKSSLPQLLKKLCQVNGLEWIRIMYLHPAHLNDEIIETVATETKILPYLDIPIQHAADKILSSMNRKHDYDALNSLIIKLKKSIANLVLRTTLMVGYPGEEENDFKELLDFMVQNEFDWLGAFSYAAEDGTVAERLDNQIPDEVKEERKNTVLRLQNGITRKKNITRLNKIEPILISSGISKNLFIGRGYYQAPEVDGITLVKTETRLSRGEIINVQLKGVRDYDMIGEYINESSKQPHFT